MNVTVFKFCFVFGIFCCTYAIQQQQTKLSDEQGTGRLMLWRFLPQYQNVDIAANFNKLKSSGDVGFFVIRDTIVVSIYSKTKSFNQTRYIVL